MSEDFTITMSAAELKMRHNGGTRYRLVAMPYMEPSHPPKVGGRWPLITHVTRDRDLFRMIYLACKLRRPPQGQIYFSTEALPDEAYEAYPGDNVVVIPVNEERATRSARDAREAVSR
jgi:hypothetical protein